MFTANWFADLLDKSSRPDELDQLDEDTTTGTTPDANPDVDEEVDTVLPADEDTTPDEDVEDVEDEPDQLDEDEDVDADAPDVEDVEDEDTTPDEDSEDEDSEPDQLDQLTARVDELTTERDDLARRLHTALVELDGRLADPTDLPFDPDHLVDADALDAAVTDLVERRPGLRARQLHGDVGAGARGAGTDGAVDLIDLMRGL